MSSLETIMKSLLHRAGISVNGPGDADLQVKNQALYKRVLRGGSMALGESYMDGWWDAKKLDEFIYLVLSASLEKEVKPLKMLPYLLSAVIFNQGRKAKAFEIGEKHYDLGNDLFQKMLDKRMVYSGAYWKNAENLDEAQEAKLDLICRKLYLQPGMSVLDVGCGWGSFCRYAAERYGVEVVGITVSKEQVALAREMCKGLNVKIELMDYRKLHSGVSPVSGRLYDRAVSVGMIEHVGYKNYRTFMQIIQQVLKPAGLFLLQSIGVNQSVLTTDPWTEKYIFPNSMLPSARQLTRAFGDLFILEDWHSFGGDYDRTLMCWYQNFENAWPELKQAYDERFFRMWKYYLLGAAGGFRARKNQLWQIVLSKEGFPNGYRSLR